MAKCPKCGRVERYTVSEEHLNELDLSGISSIAFDHKDHIFLVTFDSWGSIRGTYVYRKAFRESIRKFEVDVGYSVKKIDLPTELPEGEISVIFINRVDKSIEVWGDIESSIEGMLYRHFLILNQIEKSLRARYEIVKIVLKGFNIFIAFSEKYGLSIVYRGRIDKDLEKNLLMWLSGITERLDKLFKNY